MLSESLFRELERALCGFSKQLFLQPHAVFRAAGDGIEDAFEGSLEAALAETREVVGCRPEEVRVGEVEGRLAVLLVAAVWEVGVAVFGGEGAEVAAGGEEEVEDELGVEGPVAGVVEDHYGVEFEGGVVGCGGVVGKGILGYLVC